MEINGDLSSNKFYKFNKGNNIVELDQDDYNKLISHDKKIKIIFPYGINGILSGIREYSVKEFNVINLIKIIKKFYNSNLTIKEKKEISRQAEVNLDDLNIHKRRDILLFTNQVFIEELEFADGIYTLRIGS